MASISRQSPVVEVEQEEDTEAIISEILSETKGHLQSDYLKSYLNNCAGISGENNNADDDGQKYDLKAQIKVEASTDYNPNSTSQLSNENLKSQTSLSFLE